jgi:hypothetical protein
VLLCLLTTTWSYLRNNIFIKTAANIRRQISLIHLASSYELFNATKELIMLDVPDIKNVYWDDGEIVWEFREQDDTNDNTTSVRVTIPPIDPVDAPSSPRLLCI